MYTPWPGDDAPEEQKRLWGDLQCEIFLDIEERIECGLMVRFPKHDAGYTVPTCHDWMQEP